MEQAKGPLPEGVVTFLLTDIEGSTRLWDTDPEAMAVALATHEHVIAEIVDGAGGWLATGTRRGRLDALSVRRA